MSDEKKPLIITAALGNDDFVPRLKLPHDDHYTDGGKSFDLNVQLQRGTVLGGFGLTGLTSHYKKPDASNHENRYRLTNDRAAFGVWEAYVGAVKTIPVSANVSNMSYGEVSLSYNDTQLTPKIQNMVHQMMGTGRNVAAEYDQSPVRNAFHAGLGAANSFRLEHLSAGRLQIKPSAHVALEAGTDRLAAAAGMRVTIGQSVDRLPQKMPVANPEDNSPSYTRDPSGSAGAWYISAGIDQHLVGQNRYLMGAEKRNRMPWKASLEAAVGLTDSISAGMAYQVNENPSHGIPGSAVKPARTNSTVQGSISVRF